MKTRRFLQLALATILAVSLLGAARPASAFVKVTGPSEDYFLEIGVLLQPRLEVSHSMAADSTTFDAYLRRARILFSGQVSKWVSFFLETDQPNWGKGGDWTTAKPFFIQDAYVSFNFSQYATVSMGMMIAPFSRHFMQSAVSLSTLDYHTKLAKYASGLVWRDAGIQIRGLALNKKLDYRFAILNGAAVKDDVPRFTGRLGFNFLDAEEGFFTGGTYLGKKKIFSVGAAFDVQPNDDKVFFGIGGDVAWDLPFKGGNRLSGNFAFLYYGDDNGAVGTGVAGMGLLFDVGYAMGRFQPTLVMDWFKPKGADDFKDQDFLVGFGVAYWLQGHNANVKLQVALDKLPGLDFGDMAIVTTIQTQLFL